MDEAEKKKAAKARRKERRDERKRQRQLKYEQFVKSFNAASGNVAVDEITVKVTAKKPSAAAKKKSISVTSDAFLMSYEWRKIRMLAIKKHGNRCQCCGASPKDGIKINVDHIKPRKLYPSLALDINNLQILCNVCNHGKGNWDETDWR
jgi:5-methylcytosine-specific restriction endonuclease McrA